MNVIVSNRQKEIIDNANIDAIKDLNGLFNVDDLISKFKNYFFSKMILDATSVVNFASREVLTTLVNEIGADKLIILLPSNPEPPVEFKKLLIELKIYNFTNNIDDVVKFIENPNTYEDAIKTIDDSFNDNMYVDSSIKDGGDNYNNNGFDTNVANNSVGDNGNSFDSNMPHRSLGDMLSNFNVSDFNQSPIENNQEDDVESTTLENEESNDGEENAVENDSFNNSDENQNDVYSQFTSNNEKNTFLIYDNIDNDNYDNEVKNEKKVIGIKNVTLHAGSTSLVYMLHRVLSDTLKKNVLSVEVDKKDFKLYRNSKMISVDSSNLVHTIEESKDDVILIDLNQYEDLSVCTDILYLVEPSTIMLNRLMVENRNAFNELKDKKVILNKSLLSDNDIRTLSSEAGIEFFDSISPLNDRILNNEINNLINLLNI